MNKLNITEKQFKELYGDKIPYNIFIEPPKSDTDFIDNCLSSKLWRMNNIYTIVDKHGERIPFVMNRSQHKVYAAVIEWYRLIILKSRQQGISTFWLLYFMDDALFIDDYNVGLMAQGKAESATLLKRVKLAWKYLPKDVLDFLTIRLNKDNADEIGFSDDSTIFIRTSFRSTTLQRLHISEYGKICNAHPERARETKTGTLQALAPGNIGIIESTAEGDNDFRKMWDKATHIVDAGLERGPKDFMPVFLSWLYDPDCTSTVYKSSTKEQDDYFDALEIETGITITDNQRWFWLDQYEELDNDVYQEYPATPAEAFLRTRDGTYYATIYRTKVIKKKREISDLYDPNLDVYVAIDLGMNDTFVMVFFQKWNDEYRIIDEYENSGEGIEHYVNVMTDRDYRIARVFLPHDAKVRDLSTGQTRVHRFKELGVRRTKVLPRIPVNDGIEAVRKVMKNLYIDPKCTYLIKCLKNYSKEWDPKREVWKDKPWHDEYSNGADAMRYMAMAKIGSSTSRNTPKGGRRRQNGVVSGLSI